MVRVTFRRVYITARSADCVGLVLTAVACALRPDLALLPQGDMTEVGEKGTPESRLSEPLRYLLHNYLQELQYVNSGPRLSYANGFVKSPQLSGGQRARISLARCV